MVSVPTMYTPSPFIQGSSLLVLDESRVCGNQSATVTDSNPKKRSTFTAAASGWQLLGLDTVAPQTQVKNQSSSEYSEEDYRVVGFV